MLNGHKRIFPSTPPLRVYVCLHLILQSLSAMPMYRIKRREERSSDSASLSPHTSHHGTLSCSQRTQRGQLMTSPHMLASRGLRVVRQQF
eukprot:33846-Eustigmatos_ZCMA.PRE.1